MKIELPKKIVEGKYFLNLKAKVIDSGVCSHCGTCSAVCPAYGIVLDPSKPVNFPNWEEDCIDCGMCVRFCPRWDFKPEGGLGNYVEIFAAKSKRFEGQDGGIATELLAIAFEEGLIDRAVVVGKGNGWMPKATIVTDSKKLSEYTGTKYGFADAMPMLRKAVFRSKLGVGFIGTPCMISGLRRLQKIKSFRKVKLAIGLFCMENFYYNSLVGFLASKGIDLKSARRVGIRKGKFVIERDGEVKEIPIKEFESIVPPGCKVCEDFTAIESDVSVGSVGSPDGYSTVIVRTEVGKRLAKVLKDKCEVDNVNLKIIEKLCKFKRKR